MKQIIKHANNFIENLRKKFKYDPNQYTDADKYIIDERHWFLSINNPNLIK